MNPAILKEITDLLMAQERPGNPFPGQKNAPDVPSARDRMRLKRSPTDDNLQHYMDVFGEEALSRADRPPNEQYTPMPRPRYPDVESDIMGGYTPKTKDEIVQQGADLSEQDAERTRGSRDDYQQTMEDFTGHRPADGGLSDEEIQELIQRGLVKPRR